MSEAQASPETVGSELELADDMIVQEFGYDDDVDHALREAVEEVIGGELLDEDDQEVVDSVLLWWRDGDGDLTDALMDSQAQLDEGGVVWLLTPRSGREGYVSPTDIEQASSTAGFHSTSSAGVSADWSARRLAPKRSF